MHYGAGIDPTLTRSVRQRLARTANETYYTKYMKINKFKHQSDDWSHFLVPLFDPTFWSHRPTFRGDLVKIGRESKW